MKPFPCFPLRRSALLSLATTLLFPAGALAQIAVNTLADENDTPSGPQISLREALRDSANGGQIMFDAALIGQILVLTAGEMAVTGKTVSVTGTGSVIEARGLSRIFSVEAGAGLNLTGLTLQGGKAMVDGGAILNAGTITLTDCVLRDNQAAPGTAGAAGASASAPNSTDYTPGGAGGQGRNGGAVSSSGSFTATRCTFLRNAAGRGGNGGVGGNSNYVGSPVAVEGARGGDGATGGSGGAIFSTGSLSLSGCIFESNLSGAGGNGGMGGTGWLGFGIAATGLAGHTGDAGAIYQSGNLTADACSFVHNFCPAPGTGNPLSFPGQPGGGTAIYWSVGTATLTNCTVADNGINMTPPLGGPPPPPSPRGSAIAAGSGELLHLIHCTVAGNVAGTLSTVAGISSEGVSLRCENCIVSGNMRNTGSGFAESNFSSTTNRTVIPFGSIPDESAAQMHLGVLAITSGNQPVRVPGPGSPALNAGTTISSLTTDQRGLPRAAGAPDLGAVEVQTPEPPARAPQEIQFYPPAAPDTASIVLGASSSSGLPVSLELVSGSATLNGNDLTFHSAGFVTIKASQPGDATTAPALPVIRVIEATTFLPVNFIAFTPAANYTVYTGSETVLDLPATTSKGLPVTWTFVNPAHDGFTLSGNQLTATRAGSVPIRGQNAGNGQVPPVDSTWTLTFVESPLWWETPAPSVAGWPLFFTLVEGSPYGLRITARISVPHPEPVKVPTLPAGLLATPPSIPAGEVSVQCTITLATNPQLTNRIQTINTGNLTPAPVTLFLANRANVPLDVFPPSRVRSGESVQVNVSVPGVTAGSDYGPPPDLSLRSFTVSAVDFDNPAISIPVVLNSTSGTGPFLQRRLQVTFPPVNRRAKLTVTTDDGITGTAGPVEITIDDADGDGVSDEVETALQRSPGQSEPPLTVVRDATGLHAVLGSRPLDLKGWTVVIEISTDLQTWTPAPAASTTVTPNPGNTTERVSVVLTAGTEQQFVRLRAAKP